MAEPLIPAGGALAVLPEKEAIGKLQPFSREPPGSTSAKKVGTEEKKRKMPRRVNREEGSAASARCPKALAAWGFAARSAASSLAASRSCHSFSATLASSQPQLPPVRVPCKLLVAPSLR